MTEPGRELPVIFAPRVVRNLLAGRKTQTRRVVVPQPRGREPACGPGWLWTWWRVFQDRNAWEDRRPAYVPGDRLYVRENFAIREAGRRVSLKPEAWPDGFPLDRVVYAADYPEDAHWWNLRPSIHMPKWAARPLRLEVTETRTERLQAITTEDIQAEGFQLPVSSAGLPLLELARAGAKPAQADYLPAGVALDYGPRALGGEDFPRMTPPLAELLPHLWRALWASRWDELNRARGYGWATNPWVWVYTFKLQEV